MMEIVAVIITLVVSVLAKATIRINWNMRGEGTLLGVAILGAFILWVVWHPKDKQLVFQAEH